MIGVATIVVGILLGIAGIQELYFRGILNQEPQPFFIGMLGAVTSGLLIVAGVAILRRWPQRTGLMTLAAVLNLVFLTYSALPPHRNVGIFALVLGGALSIVLVTAARRVL